MILATNFPIIAQGACFLQLLAGAPRSVAPKMLRRDCSQTHTNFQ
jgi:hypothetical protein